MRKKLLQPIYVSYILIVIFAFSSIGWIASRLFRESYIDETVTDLEARTRLIIPYYSPSLLRSTDSLSELCNKLSLPTSTRITIILPSGKVIYDTDEDANLMDNHADRPEIMSALSDEVGSIIRYSYTLMEERMYLALPLKDQGQIYGVVRTSISLIGIQSTLTRFYSQIGIVTAIIALLSAFIFWFSSERIRREIGELIQGARRFAIGEFKDNIPPPASDEMAELATGMNVMAQTLYEKIETITRQNNETDAIITSMLDAVLAIDTDNRIINLNKQAKRMFGITGEVLGNSIIETIRNADLHRLITVALTENKIIEDEFILIDQSMERFIQVHATPLIDGENKKHGVVVVLNDVTKLRQLERSRQDFVANVSHELKTPITSISGFVETLLDGAMHDPQASDHFLTIIARQTERLNALIDDLMDLARIEQKAETHQISLSSIPVKPILEEAISQLATTADKKLIDMQLNAPDDITASVDPILLEQAVTNLINNAIRYSEPDNRVEIKLTTEENEVQISVSDNGRGISNEHLPRLFERFYRVDVGRSRQSGGTGLGLSIVKHIVYAHNGKVTVSSNVGIGSVFTIHLPKNTILTES